MLLEELILPLRTETNIFKAGLKSAGVAVAALVAGMGLAIHATFKWADELDSIQDIMGVTNKTAAALNFTLRKSGTSTEALTKGMTILSKGLVKADGSLDVTGKSLKAWGINVLDANGMLKDQTTLIGDISEKYSTFATQQEKVNFLTETFGRSGAELIDFFDTLAAEGGIDSVAAKVERLGLAIDPNRYEQFNRNLEELKLVGLGLAVNFTEKVMPVIEKFLGMLSDPEGIDFSKIAAWADNTIASFIKGLGDSINNWVSGGGPEALTETLVSWIEGIGDSDATKSKVQIAMEHLVAAIGKALSEVDWAAVRTAMSDKIKELFEANQPVGENSVRDFWNGVEIAGTNATRKAFNGMEISGTGKIRTMLQEWDNSFMTWARGIAEPMNVFESTITTRMQTAMSNLKISLNSKLTDIAKEFYARGTGWANQAAQGFEAGKQTILGKIREIVGLINAILKKIMTSFTISVTLPSLPSWPGGDAPKPKPPSWTAIGGTPGGRASGGAVIGGQSYNVAEFFRPERFTPNTSGRVDPIENKQMSLEIDYDRLGGVIAMQVIKGLNNV